MTDTPTTARARPAQTEIPIHDRIPPHDIGAEQALLGSMMIDPTCIDGILEFVTGPGQFWKEENGKLFSVLLDMHRKGAAMDGVTIIGTLTRVGKLEAVGGHDYINATISSVPSAAHAEHYAAAVRDHALLRRLISAGGRITRSGHEGGDVREIVDQAEKIIFEIGNATGSRAVTVSITDALAEALARADGQNAGLPTGLARLDELTNGMHPGEMIVIAARPSMGKTSLALNIADHIACKLGQGVLFFSKEMSRIELAQRMICSRAHVDSQRVKRNQIIADERAALKLSLQEMEGAPMWIDDSPGGTIGDFRAAARRQCAAQDVKIIILTSFENLARSVICAAFRKVSLVSC